MTDIDSDRTLASLVKETPAYARTFESLGLDYCCDGDRTLATACSQAGLDVDDIRTRLSEARDSNDVDDYDWEGLAELADHVISAHHDHLREELPALGSLVEKVNRVHGENHPELQDVEAEFRDLAAEMHDHIDEEEQELFPVVGRLDRGESIADEEAARLREAVRTFEKDHVATADRLDRIAELTDGYAVPEDACPSYRSMLDRLERLERDTHMHVHKENNVLFPRAEEQLSARTAEA